MSNMFESTLSQQYLSELRQNQSQIYSVIKQLTEAIEWDRFVGKELIQQKQILSNIAQIINYVSIPFIQALNNYKQFFVFFEKLPMIQKILRNLLQIISTVLEIYQPVICTENQHFEVLEIKNFLEMAQKLNIPFKLDQQNLIKILNQADIQAQESECNSDIFVCKVTKQQQAQQQQQTQEETFQEVEVEQPKMVTQFQQLYLSIYKQLQKLKQDMNDVQYSELNEKEKDMRIAGIYEQMRLLQPEQSIHYSKAENHLLQVQAEDINSIKIKLRNLFPGMIPLLKERQLLQSANKQNVTQTQKKLQDRTHFYLKEKLKVEEDLKVEFKNYYYPFKDEHYQEIALQICAFLNAEGGRIYFGVRDQDSQVNGIILTHKQKDDLKVAIDTKCGLQSFEPRVEEHEVRTLFLPIYSPDTKSPIPGRYIVKTIVKRGKPEELYFLPNAQCYIRRDGRKECLQPRTFKAEILRRSKMAYNKNEFAAYLNKAFNDPLPKNIVEIYEAKTSQYNNQNQNLNQQYQQSGESDLIFNNNSNNINENKQAQLKTDVQLQDYEEVKLMGDDYKGINQQYFKKPNGKSQGQNKPKIIQGRNNFRNDKFGDNDKGLEKFGGKVNKCCVFIQLHSLRNKEDFNRQVEQLIYELSHLGLDYTENCLDHTKSIVFFEFKNEKESELAVEAFKDYKAATGIDAKIDFAFEDALAFFKKKNNK